MRFLLDNGVARILRERGQDVVTAADVGLAGVEAAEDDALSVYGDEIGRVVITHDRVHEAAHAQHRRLHVRLRVDQPDGPQVIDEQLEEPIDVLGWTETAVIEVSRAGVRDHPSLWE